MFAHPVAAVLLDRDGTLIRDVPSIADPRQVEPMPGAVEAVARLRRSGVGVAVIAYVPEVADGTVSADELHQVNARVEELLGPFDAWGICAHGVHDGCICRRPAPGLVHRVADMLNVRAGDCVVIADGAGELAAARAAGAGGILVPTTRTRPDDLAAAPYVAEDLPSAVDHVRPLETAEGGPVFGSMIDQFWSRW